MRVPTDLEILTRIYDRYYSKFAQHSDAPSERPVKILVPIDIASIAHELGVDGDIVFGRLYYHLEPKYGFKSGDAHVRFFALEAGGVRHSINFPLMASVLASLQDESRRFRWSTWIAAGALLISVVALCISALA